MTEENAKKEIQIGDKMPDSSVYVGISPDTNKPLYAMPEDAGVTMKEILENYLRDDSEIPEDVGLTVDFNQAAKYVQTLNRLHAHGHNDWRLPTKEELNVLYQNKNEGALKKTFNETGGHHDNTGFYWSSSLSPNNSDDTEYVYGYVQNFKTGQQVLNPTVHDASVRYVRG